MKNPILSCTFIMKGKHDEYTGNRREIIVFQKSTKEFWSAWRYHLVAGSRPKGSDVSLSVCFFIYLF